MMIANLPLLFANGQPVALANISVTDLERFITFMVTCSWGHDTVTDIQQPPWWPSNVPFSHPFTRPAEVPKDWESRLKDLVKKCYEYHKSPFLLVFSAQLSRYQPHMLQYVDNLDRTTSLYYRANCTLLVTFRNENINYDSDQDKYTQPKNSSEIFLCDYCDSHFDKFELLKAHERLCNSIIEAPSVNSRLPDFLSALKLQRVGEVQENPKPMIVNTEVKQKNGRNAANIDRGPPFPFSSIAYLRHLKNNNVQRDMTYSRERVERYCCTEPTTSRNIGSKRTPHFPVRYKRPIDYWHRKHVFPLQRKKLILNLDSQLMLLKCKPITVDIPRMSIETIDSYINTVHESDQDIEFVDEVNCNDSSDSETRCIDPLNRVDNCVSEVIDLCSDDESPGVNENCDPRAGVTCVMRGGAVLRRTAATPQLHAMPSEPCGARQRPLPSVVLKSQPVFIVTHSLNNLKTVALD